MQLLIINSEFPPLGGGAGNASLQLARQFCHLGHEVTILTTRYGVYPLEEKVEPTLRVLRVPSFRRRKDRSGAFEQGIFMIGAGWSTLNLTRHWKPDVIIAFFGVPSGAAALPAHYINRVPYIVSLRGGDVPGFRPYDFALYHRIIAPLLHIVWRKASAVVSNSSGLKDLAHQFDPSIKIPIIYNGVDSNQYRPSPETKDNERPINILFSGRVVFQKGLDILLEALSSLKEIPWQLTIAGDGPYQTQMEEKAHTLGLAERLHFSGWLDKEQVANYYQQADIFILPSRHEGMSNVVLEAMSSGLPVIATRIAGNDEIIRDGKEGFLVPSEDINALRDALCRLLADADLRSRLGKSARQRVEQQFSWEEAARQYLSLIEQIIAQQQNND